LLAADDRWVRTSSDDICVWSGPSRKAIFGVFIGWMTALLLMHYPMIFSGMHRMQADLGDSRLNNYFLEHSWRWITLKPMASVFWNMPFFYPQQNTAAYSDLMLSFAPFYWCWRLAGLQPDTAFQCWMMVGTTLNFVVAIIWLRGCCKCSWGASVIGSIFFTAAGPRATQLGHQQLQWQMFPMLTLIGVYQIFGDARKSHSTRWWLLLGIAIVAQFWGGFYNGWFICLGLGIASLLAMLRSETRRQLAVVIRRDIIVFFAVVVGMILLLAPAAIQYLSVMKDVGGHCYQEAQFRLAKPISWILPGPFSIERLWITFPAQKLEQAVAIGLITTCVAIAGIFSGRRKPGMAILAITSLVIICLGTVFFGRYSLWWIAYYTLPGAEVIRAPARIELLLLIPAALGISQFIDHYGKQRQIFVAIVIALCLLEQATVMPSYDKQEARHRIDAITDALPRDAKCFFYVGNNPREKEQFQIDAMWASLQSGVPTLNGYSGSIPVGWKMVNDVALSNGDCKELRLDTVEWANQWAIDPRQITIIEPVCHDGLVENRIETAATDTSLVP
jgi:hypothetical protein